VGSFSQRALQTAVKLLIASIISRIRPGASQSSPVVYHRIKKPFMTFPWYCCHL
jgi:hypothetical protein